MSRDDPDKLNTTAVEIFRLPYPAGDNDIVGPAVKTPGRIRRDGRVLAVCTTKDHS